MGMVDIAPNVFLFVFILLGIFFILIPFIDPLEVGERKVPCYDRFSNLIEDLECINSTTKSEVIGQSIMFILVGIFFIVMGFTIKNTMEGYGVI